MSSIGLIVAIRREIPDILQHKKLGSHKIGNDDVYIVVSGIGPQKARNATEKICSNCSEFHPDYLMTLGFCGGVHDDLEIGHLIIADRVTYENQEIELEKKHLDKTINALVGNEYQIGKFQTFDWPVLSRNKVSEDTLAVDMESFAIAEIARNCRMPIIIIKGVCDIVPERVSLKSLWNLVTTIRNNTKNTKSQLNNFAKQYFLT